MPVFEQKQGKEKSDRGLCFVWAVTAMSLWHVIFDGASRKVMGTPCRYPGQRKQWVLKTQARSWLPVFAKQQGDQCAWRGASVLLRSTRSWDQRSGRGTRSCRAFIEHHKTFGFPPELDRKSAEGLEYKSKLNLIYGVQEPLCPLYRKITEKWKEGEFLRGHCSDLGETQRWDGPGW